MKSSKLIAACVVALALTSCSSNKTVLPYFTGLPDNGLTELTEFEIKIVPGDELLINVSAADPLAVEDYIIPISVPQATDINTPVGQSMESTIIQRKSSSLRVTTYKVSQKGFITFPVLGKIHVEGMTLEGLAQYLTEKISEKVVDPIVTVDLINFHISVMGEVNLPGVQLINRERVSILDALAAARDLNQYGERERVLIIREEDGKRHYHYVNLNDPKLLESPYFYLKQNDVIYVEPNHVKQTNANITGNRQFNLSVTSVIVSAASVIASLAIALFIRR